MRRKQRIVLLTTLAVILPVLAGCADFDLDKLDVFHLNEKKKLPGDRQPLFPEGVPGVTQGVPKEYYMGNQQPTSDAALVPPDAPVTPAAEQKQAAVPAEEPKPAAKPKVAAKPKPKKTAKRAAPKRTVAAPVKPVTQQPASAPAAAPAPWPEPAQNQNAGATAPWPAAPPPGTFTR